MPGVGPQDSSAGLGFFWGEEPGPGRVLSVPVVSLGPTSEVAPGWPQGLQRTLETWVIGPSLPLVSSVALASEPERPFKGQQLSLWPLGWWERHTRRMSVPHTQGWGGALPLSIFRWKASLHQ